MTPSDVGVGLVKQEPVGDGSKIEVGQWYWVEGEGKESPWLACVTWLGSNYVEVTRVDNSSTRIHIDAWSESVWREYDPDIYIAGKVGEYRSEADRLMTAIRALTAKLGLTPVGELTDGTRSESSALVVAHGVKDVQAHKAALVKAKEKTLPELFKKVEKAHEAMAMWMKAKLIPMRSEAGMMKERMRSIEDRIFTVELYAGLTEELVLLRKGEPASNDEKIHLFQRRHYMDEECLVDYQAGGMELADIRKFDRWLMRKKNRERILPFPKCVVAFQVRRRDKRRESVNLFDFIRFWHLRDGDKATFLYIRNGDRYYRLSTSIEFGDKLFPDAERSELLHGKLYIGRWGASDVKTQRDIDEMRSRDAEREAKYKAKLAAWKKLSKKEREEKRRPWRSGSMRDADDYVHLDRDTVYYDDGMREVAKIARKHNRLAVVMQGLLDRSPAFHPHPPWQLWTPDGFGNALELVFDDDRTIAPGESPDFEAYRARLNASIRKGTHCTGQYALWREACREEDRYDNAGRRVYWVDDYGNRGPELVDVVHRMSRDKNQCTFRYERERMRPGKWVPNPDKPGYLKRDWSNIPVLFTCATAGLLNVDAYTPGDFKQFYSDPRTRADYLKWAPLMLAAEDWHARKEGVG